MSRVDVYLVPSRSFCLFSFIPDVSDGSHEVNSVVHRDRAEQLEDLLTEILKKEKTFDVCSLYFPCIYSPDFYSPA